MADRNGYIGRAPGDSSVIIARKAYEPTGVQTDFTFNSGYTPGYCDVYLNGVKLIDEKDFTASNGSTVGLTSAAQSGDIVELVVYKAYNLGVPLADVTGNLDITGYVSASSSITAGGAFYGDGSNLSNIAGVAITQYIAADSLTVIGSPGVSTITRLGATDLNVTGIITANGLVGNVTGAAITVTGQATFSSNVSIGGTLTYEDVTNVDSLGIVTARAGVNVSGGQLTVGVAYSVGSAGVATALGFVGPLTGAVTGDSAGTHTGAVDLNGGVLTLDADADTTITADTDDQIDIAFGGSDRITLSTGLIDLKNSGSQSALRLYCESSNAHYTALQAAAHSAYSGNATVTLPASTDTLIGRATTDTLTNKTLTSPTINTLSGDTASFSSNLTVGSGITFGSAGVATFSGTGDVHLLDNVQLNVGDSSDLVIKHNGSDSFFNSNTGNIDIRTTNAGSVNLRADDKYGIYIQNSGTVKLYHNNNAKFETTNDGTVTTGICTATRSYVNTPTRSENKNIPLLVKSIKRSEPGIAVEGENANGFTVLADAYVDGESQFTLGLHYSGSGVLLAQNVGVNTSSNDEYVSIQDDHAFRASGMILDNGSIRFRNTDENSVRPVGAAVTMTDRMVIERGGRVLIGDFGTYSASGDLHIVGDTNSNGPELYLQVNNNNTTDNLGALWYGNNGDKSLNKIAGHTKLASNTSYLTFHTSKAGTLGQRLEINNDGTVTSGIATITSPSVNSVAIIGTGSHELYSYHDSGGAGWATGAGAGNYGELLYFDESNGNVHIYAEGEQCAHFKGNAEVGLFYNATKKFETTNDGVSISGIATVSQGLNTDGLLSEKFNTTAGKLSDNTNIDLEDGMVHYFSTQETTTCTPNIRYSSSKSLNNMLSIGDAISVTVITTAAAGGYSANWTIDSGSRTEEWVGGSAPSAGGSDGLDIYGITILKTGNGTYKFIANLTNAT